MDIAIQSVDLVKTYGPVLALDRLDFQVDRGTIFALLGPNGAGKSTAVKILTTLALPDSGRATVDGIDVAREPRRVRRVIGVVSQQPAVDLDATGRENLQLQGSLYGIRGPELRARVAALLERFELAGAAGRIAGRYSGGMRRKLDVAMGLIHNPRALFLDEPTTGLDPEARAALWSEIARLARDEGVTILLTTHYLDEADHLADRVAIMDRGRIVAEGSPDQLKAELRGDAVQVELAEPGAEVAVAAALQSLNGAVCDTALSGRTLRARADDGARTLPSLLAALEAAGIAVASATVSRPSLDDVYLAHTGRSFHEAHAEEAA